jgi:ribosomal protein S14
MAKAHATGQPFPNPTPHFSACTRTDRHSVVNGEKKKSGLIRKYGLNMSRQAFREKATDMGWIKVRQFWVTSGMVDEADGHGSTVEC